MAKAPKQPKDPLDQFEKQCNEKIDMAVAMLLWKDRFNNPEMAVQVTPQDIAKLQASVDYLQVQPKVLIKRPRGRPAQEGVPEGPGRRAVPAKAAEPDRPFVMIMLVDQDGNGFKPIENDEESAKLRDAAIERGKLKDRAPQVAADILKELLSGIVESTQREAARMLVEMARMLK